MKPIKFPLYSNPTISEVESHLCPKYWKSSSASAVTPTFPMVYDSPHKG